MWCLYLIFLGLSKDKLADVWVDVGDVRGGLTAIGLTVISSSTSSLSSVSSTFDWSAAKIHFIYNNIIIITNKVNMYLFLKNGFFVQGGPEV